MRYTAVLDTESDGLWGIIVAIGMIIYDEQGREVAMYNKRSDHVISDDWAMAHVWPHIQDIPIVGSLEELLSDFAQFYLSWAKRGDVDFLWYGGHVVEAYLFRLLRDRGLIGDYDAPYTPIELTAHLMLIGADPVSVEEYLINQGIELPDGVVDTPIYDCKISYICYRHIISNYSLTPYLGSRGKKQK